MAIAVSDWPYKLLTPYFFKGIYADRVSNVRMKIVPSINNEGKKSCDRHSDPSNHLE